MQSHSWMAESLYLVAPTSDSDGMEYLRFNPSTTLLPNGQILVVGGIAIAQEGSSTAEIFDPESLSFFRTGDLSTPISGCVTATLMPDDSIILIGQSDSNTKSAHWFDSSTGKFELIDSPILNFSGCSKATLVQEGEKFHPDGSTDYLLIVTNMGYIMLFDPKVGKTLTLYKNNDPGQLNNFNTSFFSSGQPQIIPLKDGRIVLIGSSSSELLAITYDPSIDTLNTTEWRRTFSVNSTITEIDNSSI